MHDGLQQLGSAVGNAPNQKQIVKDGRVGHEVNCRSGQKPLRDTA